MLLEGKDYTVALDIKKDIPRELTITEYNTIYGFALEETKLEEFLKKFKKKMKKDIENYCVEYDKEENKFFLTKNGYKYILNIDAKVMEDYAFGKYNYATSKLNDLYTETCIKKEGIDLQQEENSKMTEIVNSNKLPSLADAPMYVQYLEKANKEELKGMKKELVGLAVASAPTTVAVIVTGIFLSSGPLPLMIGGSIFAGIGTFGIQELISIGLDCDLDKYIHKAVNKFKQKMEKRKINKYKIKQIKQMQYYDRIIPANSYLVSEFDQTIEAPIKQDLLSFKNIVIADVNSIVDRISFINAENRGPLLYEAKQILDEYNSRYNAIQNNDNSFELEADTELNLKMDMMKKISSLEMKLMDIRNKDIKIGSVENEKAQLVEKIDRLDNETKELNKSQRIKK